MATTNQPALVLLASRNPTVIEVTQAALANEEDLTLIETEVTSGNLFQVINQAHPVVILLDFEFTQQPFNLVDRIASEHPDCTVIVILSESEMANSDRVILSGARAFIQTPYQERTLVITIKRVIELLERHKPQSPASPAPEFQEQSPRKTLAVFSPKGGAGTTTVAINLAIGLHKALKEDVLLIDGKHLFGHVTLYLNLRTGNSITDLIAHAGMLDQRLIKQVVEQHTSGIHVLPSPNSISAAQGIRPENLFKVIQSMQQAFPYIIIDAGNTISENTVTYLDASDKILLVLNPDLASMRDVRLFKDISASLSYSKEKTLLVVNCAGRKADIKNQEIENILKTEIFGNIPADENQMLSCLNEGVPILLKQPRHRISKAYTKLTKDLLKSIQTAKTD